MDLKDFEGKVCVTIRGMAQGSEDLTMGYDSYTVDMTSPLTEEIRKVLNKVSAENASNTPDFILAEYISTCLDAFNRAVNDRNQWYGRQDVPGKTPEVQTRNR